MKRTVNETMCKVLFIFSVHDMCFSTYPVRENRISFFVINRNFQKYVLRV